ncbi:hypothetical protein [Xanthovirga aplysinae]|uniref:hypothetical protein n=1 Tax=Xanthovirga aplysinae TaxID=2529853 RepID=UPI001CA41F77|nr:hypothetical protein [Xanthovirga aplysinae]MTI29446.1 hypothetical protein [Xanthovirga aplysinae]
MFLNRFFISAFFVLTLSIPAFGQRTFGGNVLAPSSGAGGYGIENRSPYSGGINPSSGYFRPYGRDRGYGSYAIYENALYHGRGYHYYYDPRFIQGRARNPNAIFRRHLLVNPNPYYQYQYQYYNNVRNPSRRIRGAPYYKWNPYNSYTPY